MNAKGKQITIPFDYHLNPAMNRAIFQHKAGGF